MRREKAAQEAEEHARWTEEQRRERITIRKNLMADARAKKREAAEAKRKAREAELMQSLLDSGKKKKGKKKGKKAKKKR